MSNNPSKKKCLSCGEEKSVKANFYVSYSPLHADGKQPFCKKCLQKMTDIKDIESVKDTLRQIDRPFLADLWNTSLQDGRDPFGMYIKNLALPHNRKLTWNDSIFGEYKNKETSNSIVVASTIKEEKTLKNSRDNNPNLTDAELEKLEDRWGYGFEPYELVYFERKYKSLVGNYPAMTTLHEEALRTYCVYKVRAELETAKGNVSSAKEWAKLAQSQGEIAKINLNKLTKSDLSQGLDSFSELVRMVEREVDIIPILPAFVAKPQDEIDFAIYSFINYERRLNGLPEVEHSDIYEFYQEKLREFLKDSTKNPEVKKNIIEVEIDSKKSKTGKKKILFYDVYSVIEKRKKEEPDNVFIQNLDKWVEFVSWSRWMPDLWYDMITPEEGGIELHPDQRIVLRCLARFKFVYCVFSRGFSKTYLELMYNYHTCIFYPDMEIAMTAQTMENAVALIDSKWREISKHFPMINHELAYEPKTNGDRAIVEFKSGGRIDTLPNGQSAKGQRRKRIAVEEFAQVNNDVFVDCIEPIPFIPRITLGKLGTISPYELNHQIIYLTTSWYAGSDAYEKGIDMSKNMVNLKGEIILGSDWQLPCFYGRGESRNAIIEKKERISPTFFALNYESRWIGILDGALVSINKVMDLRVLSKAELIGQKNGEYYIGVDVARSESSSNNQCSVAVLKVKRNDEGRINVIQLVNIINIPSILNFKVQAQEVMRIRNNYHARMVIVDGNGLGKGLIDQLVLEQIDPITGESLGCWKTINTDQESELENAKEILYDLKAQSAQSNNSDVIVNFIDMVESKKLQLLEKRTDTNYDIQDEDYMKNEKLPYLQTDYLLDEIANLKLKPLTNGRVGIEQQTKSVNKDRYSALAYALWYIKEFEDDFGYADKNAKVTDYLFIN